MILVVKAYRCRLDTGAFINAHGLSISANDNEAIITYGGKISYEHLADTTVSFRTPDCLQRFRGKILLSEDGKTFRAIDNAAADMVINEKGKISFNPRILAPASVKTCSLDITSAERIISAGQVRITPLPLATTFHRASARLNGKIFSTRNDAVPRGIYSLLCVEGGEGYPYGSYVFERL